MVSHRARSGWVGRLALLSGLLFLLLSACTTSAPVVAPAPTQTSVMSEEDDLGDLIAQLQSDLNRRKNRESAVVATAKPAPGTAKQQQQTLKQTFAERAKALFSKIDDMELHMPVVGVRTSNLYNSWGDPRDGGKRKHRGIDIFAKKGTPVVAVTDGVITFIGEQRKGGQCLWLTTESGTSFYYAHLDRWAPGLYEGMDVKAGDLLGYVGNTGNAISTPPHLHFGINQNDEMVNPYPILSKAIFVARAQVNVELGGGFGTR